VGRDHADAVAPVSCGTTGIGGSGFVKAKTTRFEKIVGVFLILSMAVLAYAVAWKAKREKLFSRVKTFRLSADRGYGIRTGTVVAINDVAVGVVTDYEMKPDEITKLFEVEVEIQVEGEHADKIRADSLAHIKEPPVIGDTKINIAAGKPHWVVARDIERTERRGKVLYGVVAKDGVVAYEVLPGTARKGGEAIPAFRNPLKKNDRVEILEQAREGYFKVYLPEIPEGGLIEAPRPESLMEKFGDIPTELALLKEKVIAALEKINKIIENIKVVTTDLAEAKGSAGKLLKEDALYNNINETIAEVRTAVKETQKVVADIKTTTARVSESSKDIPDIVSSGKKTAARVEAASVEIEGIMKDIPEILAAVKRILADVEGIAGNVNRASGDIPELVRSGKEGVKEAEQLLRAAKRHWLIRGYVAPEPPVLTDVQLLEKSEKERKGGKAPPAGESPREKGGGNPVQ
jgi:phospholipid/cholesterol/gamma-HCH transport system substrate-binding protein